MTKDINTESNGSPGQPEAVADSGIRWLWAAFVSAVSDATTSKLASAELATEVSQTPPLALDAFADTIGYLQWFQHRTTARKERKQAFVSHRIELADIDVGAEGGLESGASESPHPTPSPAADTPDPRSLTTTFSVVVPVYKPKLWFLRRCVESVQEQTYPHWELCLCDDASGDEETVGYLREAAKADPRIKFLQHARNGGISKATNTALTVATGEFIALLDHDDELTPDALETVAAAIAADPFSDLIYSDEDKLSTSGKPCNPHFKPAWSPDLLLSYPYLGHLLVIRHQLLQDLGGFRSEMDGSQDYDLMLRASEKARSIIHIPEVLYHWRTVEGSAAGEADAKPWAHDASRRALTDALQRRGSGAKVETGPFPGAYYTRWPIVDNPLVSIIIPFRDQAAMLRTCVDSLGVDSGYDRFEVVLVDNDSTEPETFALIDRLLERPGFRLMHHPGPFNWSAINNAAVATCKGDLLLFLNNDIEALGNGWLGALVEQAIRPEIGAVGCRLLYPDGTIQHAGVTLGMGGIAGHVLCGIPGDSGGYMGWAKVIRNYSVVTAASMMCRRSVFDEVGGFDEQFAVGFNDVDFCIRVGLAGYRIVYSPLATLIHYESKSRGVTGFYADYQVFLNRWTKLLQAGDPYYSPHLSRLHSECRLRPPDEDEQWEEMISMLNNSSGQ